MALVVNQEERTERLAVLQIDPIILLSMLRNLSKGANVKVDGIPTDAKMLRCGVSPDGEIRMLVASESFEKVHPSCPAPELHVSVQIG